MCLPPSFWGLCRQLVSDAGGTEIHVGIWGTRSKVGSATVVVSNECDQADIPGSDCADKNNSKCKTNKAFIIIGILANVGALVLLAVGIGPAIVPPVLAGLAGFSYLIVWAIYAGQINAEAKDCGFKDSTFELGGAFGCTIVAWLLCWAGAAAAFMSGKSEG
jgi:hypothetical protein